MATMDVRVSGVTYAELDAVITQIQGMGYTAGAFQEIVENQNDGTSGLTEIVSTRKLNGSYPEFSVHLDKEAVGCLLAMCCPAAKACMAC